MTSGRASALLVGAFALLVLGASAHNSTREPKHANATEISASSHESGSALGSLVAYAAMVLSTVLVSGLCCLCGVCVVVGRGKLRDADCEFWPPAPQRYQAVEGIDADARIRGRLLAEFLFALTAPWLTLAIVLPIGVFVGKQATTIGLIALATASVYRTKAIEVALLRLIPLENPPGETLIGHTFSEIRAALCKFEEPAFILSALEVFDMLSDGAATAAALLLDSAAKRRFVVAWSAGPLGPYLGPVASRLGPGGLLALALAFATWCQLGDGLGGTPEERPAIQADLAGMGDLARRLRKPGMGKAGVIVARVLGENAPQMTLQVSLMMAVGLSLWEQPLLVSSLFLSLGTASAKALDLTRRSAEGVKKGFAHSLFRGVFSTLASIFFCVSLWALIFYTAAKVYFLEVCPEHAWGLTTGCVDFAE